MVLKLLVQGLAAEDRLETSTPLIIIIVVI